MSKNKQLGVDQQRRVTVLHIAEGMCLRCRGRVARGAEAVLAVLQMQLIVKRGIR